MIAEELKNIVEIIVPKVLFRPLLNYTQMGFLFRQFWPIDIFIVES